MRSDHVHESGFLGSDMAPHHGRHTILAYLQLRDYLERILVNSLE